METQQVLTENFVQCRGLDQLSHQGDRDVEEPMEQYETLYGTKFRIYEQLVYGYPKKYLEVFK